MEHQLLILFLKVPEYLISYIQVVFWQLSCFNMHDKIKISNESFHSVSRYASHLFFYVVLKSCQILTIVL